LTPEAEAIPHRVQRCFAFIDLSGFTAYTEAYGDDEAVRLLHQLRAAVRQAGERHGVRVTKWLGDGAMLSGVETGAVIACVADIVAVMRAEARLPLRAGISQGDVIMFEGDDYIGAAVNVAARLCQDADAGQILIAERAAAGVPPGMETRDLPPMTLSGITNVVLVCELFVDPTAAERL
jgi:adenylate cyclase